MILIIQIRYDGKGRHLKQAREWISRTELGQILVVIEMILVVDVGIKEVLEFVQVKMFHNNSITQQTYNQWPFRSQRVSMGLVVLSQVVVMIKEVLVGHYNIVDEGIKILQFLTGQDVLYQVLMEIKHVPLVH